MSPGGVNNASGFPSYTRRLGYNERRCAKNGTTSMPEPSILDYLKAKTFPWRGPAPEIPSLPKGKRSNARFECARAFSKRRHSKVITFAALPWRSGLAFILFVAAQNSWAPPDGSWQLGLPLATIATGLTIWALREGEWRLPKMAETDQDKRVLTLRRVPLLLSLLFFGLTFLFSGGNHFNFLNLSLWILGVGFAIVSFWQIKQTPQKSWVQLKEYLQNKEWSLRVSRWAILLIIVFGLIAFFRFYHLASAPAEMTSDHAEKLLDVYDILNGQTLIFFPRNTGREPLQFYLTAAVSQLFATGLTFLSLKIGTTFFSFVSLVYMYLLGKELGGRWVGLFAVLLTGVGYWPNLLARTGLRFSLYPTFAAPTLYYLLRGLRRGTLNDFLLSGLFLGIGLLGYTSFRILPLVAVVALIVFLLHRPAVDLRKRALIGFALLALVSLVVFTPLLRYMIDHFSEFGFRMLSRIGETERPYPGPVWQIFPVNVLRGLGMFNFSGGDIWLVGLVRRPAFDLISAALLLLGIPLLIARYLRQRHWQDLFLLLALPLLMLSSTLSLAFPEENPAMNRASGAWVPAFLICALGLDALLHGIRQTLGGKAGLRVAQVAGLIIVLFVAVLNFRLFFGQYITEYDLYSWNTSELGSVIADYGGSFGTLDSAWVVAFPYWVDTRLVAMNAGYSNHDYGVWPDQLSNTLIIPPPKLFLLKPEDNVGLSTLQQLYPQGLLSRHTSRVPTKEFMIFLVPAQGIEQ